MPILRHALLLSTILAAMPAATWAQQYGPGAGGGLIAGTTPGTFSSQSLTSTGGNTPRTLADVAADVHNVIFYGALGGAITTTAAINAALAPDANGVYHDVYLPPIGGTGKYHITSSLTISPAQCLFGDNPGSAVLSIQYDYSPTAGAPIVLTGNGNETPCVHDLSVEFTQPTVASRASFATLSGGCGSGGLACKYPPAIDLSGATNPHVMRVHIGNAWDCIYGSWTGSQGVGRLEDVDCGAYDKGLNLLNNTGAFLVTNYSFFPWDLSSPAVYADGNTFAATLTGMNGFNAVNFFSQGGRIQLEPSASVQWAHFSNAFFDGGATFESLASGGWTTIDGGYSTGSNVQQTALISVTNGNVYVANHEVINNALSNFPSASVAAGWLSMTGSQIIQSGAGDSAVSQTGGVLTLTGETVSIGTPTTFTAPLIKSTGGITVLTGNHLGDNGAGSSGVAISLTNDSSENMVADNSYGAGFTFVPPGAGGSYQGTSWATYAPSVSCSGGSLGAYTSNGSFEKVGKKITVSVSAAITTVGSCTGNLLLSLPANPATNASGIGRDNNTGASLPVFLFSPSAVLYLTKYDGSSDAASGNNFQATVTYQTQ